jgi:hypothetical protein
LKNKSSSPSEIFQEVLNDLMKHDEMDSPLSIAVTIDAGVLNAAFTPFSNHVNSPQGLTYEDLIGIARIAGTDPNVSVVLRIVLSLVTDSFSFIFRLRC